MPTMFTLKKILKIKVLNESETDIVIVIVIVIEQTRMFSLNKLFIFYKYII